jgi:hypothetical protein
MFILSKWLSKVVRGFRMFFLHASRVGHFLKIPARPLNLLFLTIFLVAIYNASASTPNPGHAWSQVGHGLWEATGTTQYRVFGFPDVDADVLTDYNIVQGDLLYGSAASTTTRLPKDTNATRYLTNKGASNNPSWSTVTLSNGVDGILSSTNGGTGNASTTFAGQTIARTYTLPDANATILTDNADVSLTQGGTNASLTASNGGIFYSTASAAAILSGVASANRILLSGNSTAPTWSTASYPSTVTASGSVLVSDGTNVVSQDQTITTTPTRPLGATGAFTATAMSSLTVFKVGLFNVPQAINVNMLSISPTNAPVPGTIKLCLYDAAGAKVIDTTTTGAATSTTLSTTTASTVQLEPGNYYMAVGCATTCNVTFNYWTTSAGPLATLTPTGKKVYEGTVTMTSGTCNATLPTITATISKTPVGRLDN